MKKVKSITSVGDVPPLLVELYYKTGNSDVELDESDLIIFRLMGARFTDVAFVESNQSVEQVEFVAF